MTHQTLSAHDSTPQIPRVDFARGLELAMADPEFSREIRYFTGSLKLAHGPAETVAVFEDGQLSAVHNNTSTPDADHEIVIRGTDEHWSGLLAEFPVPFFQCLQTCNIKHGMELSGSYQRYAYLPALNRLVALLRTEAVRSAH